jgi:hypothetical protein
MHLHHSDLPLVMKDVKRGIPHKSIPDVINRFDPARFFHIQPVFTVPTVDNTFEPLESKQGRRENTKENPGKPSTYLITTSVRNNVHRDRTGPTSEDTHAPVTLRQVLSKLSIALLRRPKLRPKFANLTIRH